MRTCFNRFDGPSFSPRGPERRVAASGRAYWCAGTRFSSIRLVPTINCYKHGRDWYIRTYWHDAGHVTYQVTPPALEFLSDRDLLFDGGHLGHDVLHALRERHWIYTGGRGTTTPDDVRHAVERWKQPSRLPELAPPSPPPDLTPPPPDLTSAPEIRPTPDPVPPSPSSPSGAAGCFAVFGLFLIPVGLGGMGLIAWRTIFHGPVREAVAAVAALGAIALGGIFIAFIAAAVMAHREKPTTASLFRRRQPRAVSAVAAADYHRFVAKADTAKQAGDLDAAIEHLRSARAAYPDGHVAANNLAWRLVTHPNPTRRDAAEARRLARLACNLTGEEEPAYLDTYAAALAAEGDMAAAVGRQEQAIRLCNDPSDALLMRLDAYRAALPPTKN